MISVARYRLVSRILLQMSSISKISRAALKRMFQEGKPFKDSRNGVTLKAEFSKTPLDFTYNPERLAKEVCEEFSLIYNNTNVSARFHLYGLELGLETLSEESFDEKVILKYIISSNERVAATQRIPFYLIVEIREADVNATSRYCKIFSLSEEDRKYLKVYLPTPTDKSGYED